MPRLAYTSVARGGRRAFARRWPSLALLAMAAWFLSPAIGTGYWAEDAYYSTMIVGWPIARGSSWLADAAGSVRHSMLVGRFYPLTPVITAATFQVFRTLTGYKSYIVAMTVLDVAIFASLVRRLTGRRGFAWLSALVTISLFQFRLSVDPLLAYYGQIQWVAAALFVSLESLQRHLDRGGWAPLIISAGAFWSCTLSYEATYALLPLPILLIVAGRRPGEGSKRTFALTMPYLAAVSYCGGMTALMRWLHPTDNYIHHADASATMALRSWGYQMSAALPLSYYLADPLSLFEGHRGASAWLDWLLQPDVIAVAVASMLIGDRAFRNGRKTDADEPFLRRWPTVLMLGVGLVGLTPILTSISTYHRAYLRPGVGWIGVLIEYFGMGLLIALALWRLAGSGRPFGRGKCLAASAVVACVAGLTYRANLEVAASFGAPQGSSRHREFAAMHGLASQIHRENVEAAVRAGGMDEIIDGSRIAMSHAYALWHDPSYGEFFYAKETGRKVEMFPSKRPTALPLKAPLFRVIDQARDRDRGFVIVSPGSLSADSKVFDLGGGRICIRHPALDPECRSHELPGVIVTAAPSTGPGEFDFDEGRRRGYRPGLDLPAIRVGAGWGVYALPGSIDDFDPDSVKLVDSPPQVASWLEALGPKNLAGGPTALSKTR